MADLMDTSWISIAISSVVLIVQLTSRYHKDGAASEVNLRNLEALFMAKLAEIQIQIAKLPDEMMTRVSQKYVTVDRYAAEIDNIKARLHSIERTIDG
jgi:hypothetical protein